MNLPNVANRRDFAVVPVKGFSPERIRSLKNGMEITLGAKILAASIMDRDYRCDGERQSIAKQCELFCDHVAIHRRKEIENFLLVPAAMDRAAARRVLDQAKRTGSHKEYNGNAAELLDSFSLERKSYVSAQRVGARIRFERANSPTLNQATVTEESQEFDSGSWSQHVLA